jgi:uncharacterized membrane protein SpoIIM required for sporulation
MAGGRGPSSSREELLKVLSSREKNGSLLLVFASALFSNNTLVSLLIFGLGVLGGVPTLLLVLANGLMAGALMSLHTHRGLSTELTGWLMIHGVTELAAIVIFAAAGLRMGALVLWPGRRTRVDALAAEGGTIGEAAVGGVIMLLVAAFLEGVGRQTVVATDQRLVIGAGTLMFWAVYFTFIGRKE